jgi:GNAT superfamily N-acetyltransferase
MRLAVRPVTRERLADLGRFSQAHGRFRYCSCMRWRMTSSEFQRASTDERAARLEQLVREGTPIGLLGYQDDEPVAWCSIAPRETYAALARSRSIPRVDGTPAWSVVCFFVDGRLRGRGGRSKLLEAAVAYARENGAPVVEGYPVESPGASYGYMGRPEMYEHAGFVTAARSSAPGAAPRLVMRRRTGPE